MVGYCLSCGCQRELERGVCEQCRIDRLRSESPQHARLLDRLERDKRRRDLHKRQAMERAAEAQRMLGDR